MQLSANALSNAIDSVLDDSNDYTSEVEGEYGAWKRGPKWSAKEHDLGEAPTAVTYWVSRENSYLSLSRFTIDMLTIPASSCEFERLFSDLGDLIEPERRKIGS